MFISFDFVLDAIPFWIASTKPMLSSALPFWAAGRKLWFIGKHPEVLNLFLISLDMDSSGSTSLCCTCGQPDCSFYGHTAVDVLQTELLKSCQGSM